ncbi:hypothetical protein TsFJ059_004082 [Trichoderma semiorbis]|uniref:Uncharacterized protein n=1 Tax=Trichoderma semiorbis TaxID=1491008 RepID=A0A9P8HQ82_9HYPO|nr:hypothetical protein TsFJ059_004082 [Trichoderma semiorbis]
MNNNSNESPESPARPSSQPSPLLSQTQPTDGPVDVSPPQSGKLLGQLRTKWEDGSISIVGVALALSLPHHQVTVFANASLSVSAADGPGNLQSPVEAQQPLSLPCRGFKTDERGGEEREAR